MAESKSVLASLTTWKFFRLLRVRVLRVQNTLFLRQTVINGLEVPLDLVQSIKELQPN